ncbi:primosomal protein N' [Paraferrimonas haliotis]|uniref:Replication restart protein PriA n=1 Tax=Paraferrimonas haliotis TaxID=2013866 RepID=A0AA37TV01_9GAMM|nr:primosomal protein N' [Paraferrimonas haliotis]GLS82301.1 primosomal protein N' [Paraferrimonas haliotis]
MTQYVEVALAVPLRKTFSYGVPKHQSPAHIGARVLVRFGPQTQVGLVVAHSDTPQVSPDKVRSYIKCLDDQALFPETLLQLCQWAARYYFAPLGQMLTQALPLALRQDVSATLETELQWSLTDAGEGIDLSEFKRAKQQLKVLTALNQSPLPQSQMEQIASKSVLKVLQDKGVIQAQPQPFEPDLSWRQQLQTNEAPLTLNSEQAIAVAAISSQQGFQTSLLEGITGSGKTEVYLHLIDAQLKKGNQVLVLVPEIGLTPQTVSRFQRRFDVPISVLHSSLTPKQRLNAWLRARAGESAIIIGTRSALFTPMKWPGLIILDEEHDQSFKQQEGVRYHARDLAVMRGHLEQVPVLLGTATPSLETLHNALSERYHHYQLKSRAGNAAIASHSLIDLTHQPLEAGISPALFEKIGEQLRAGNQVMLFLNRRGYAPALLCHECGHLHQCQRCDAFYTLHKSNHQIHCHHCDDVQAIPHQCVNCSSTLLFGHGVGTEQLEQVLAERFNDYPIVRIDRDSTRRKGELDKRLKGIKNGDYRILIGTQMLAKGHHFPDVTLVGLVDVDGALFSSDFRAPEKVAQLITQVAGRAGRASKPGHVVLQTHQPQHPVIQQLLREGYGPLSRSLLTERQHAMLPPSTHMLLFQAEAHEGQRAYDFLFEVANLLRGYQALEVLGPLPAAIERKAGKYRYHLICQAANRNHLQAIIEANLDAIEQLELARKCRWNLDRDPQDLS